MGSPARATPPVRPSAVYRRLMESLPVRTPQRQIVPLRFNAAQEHLWTLVAPKVDAREPIQLIVLKARREGVSTFVEALLTALCFFENHTQAMVVAHEAKATQRIWGMSERMVRGSPLTAVGTIKGRTIHFRESMLELATAGSPEAARSADLTCLHNSELGFWKREGALLALRQCLPQDEGSFFVEVDESTANGMVDDGEEFYDEWQAAEAGDNDFVPVFLPWQTFPAYCDADQAPLEDLNREEADLVRDLGLTAGQLRWRRRTIANRCQGNVDKFNQEYPATPEMAFIMTGHPYFSLQDLLWCEPHVQRGRRGTVVEHRGRVVCQEDARGLVRIFRAPERGHQYVIGADSAMGHDDDSHSQSAAEVLDMATLEQVAEYAGPAPPHRFARDLALLGRAYNEALLFPEVQSSGGGGGREVVVYLRDTHNYPYIGTWLGANDRIRPAPPTLLGWECVAPEARILTADLVWKPAASLQLGERIVGCEEKQGLNGKGYVPRMRLQTVVAMREFVAPRLVVTLDDGRQTCVSNTHPFWTGRRSLGRWRWIQAQHLRIGDCVKCLPLWEPDRSYEAGRMAGLMDGEGHLSFSIGHSGLALLISQVAGPLADEILGLWKYLGFKAVAKYISRENRPREQVMTQTGVKHLAEVLRALGTIRPTRLLRRFQELDVLSNTTIRSFRTAQVADVEIAGDGPVIGLTASPNHTLIADGIVGHNTTARTKPMLLARVEEVILERSTTIHSRALLKQIRSYGRSDTGAMEALVGHDDLFMAFGIALMGRFQQYVATPRPPTPRVQLPLERVQRETMGDLEERDRTVLEEVLAGGRGATRTPTDLMAW